jgi:hypothetical protein
MSHTQLFHIALDQEKTFENKWQTEKRKKQDKISSNQTHAWTRYKPINWVMLLESKRKKIKNETAKEYSKTCLSSTKLNHLNP